MISYACKKGMFSAVALLLFIVGILSPFFGGRALATSSSITEPAAPQESAAPASLAPNSGTPKPTYDPNNPQVLQDLFLYAETAVLIEQHSGKVLYDMKAEQQMQPASITKIMTLLLAVENGNLQDKVTVGKEIWQIPNDSSKVYLIEGEELSLEELLYGLMIRSGNDAAMTIAVHIAGSVEAFVDMMNKRAEEIGCTGTHFNNPHGYEDKDHYTTAMDMARIARVGMENETFREIVKTPSFTIRKNNMRDDNYTMKTNNQFVGRDENMKNQYEYGTGIKSGYFSKAQHTFVGSATKNDVDLIAVVMKTTQQGKWTDTTRLMEYGFAICHPYSLQELYESAPVYLNLEGLSEDGDNTLKLELKDAQEIPMLFDTQEDIEEMKNNFSQYYHFEGAQQVTGPVKQGEEMGTLVFQPIDGEEIRYPLISSRTIEEDKPFGMEMLEESKGFPVILIVLGAIIVALLLILIIRYFMSRNRRYRPRRR